VSDEADFDFRHFYRDVVVLLGGRIDIADLLDKSKDGVTEEDVDRVRNYAIELFTARKTELASLHKLQIRVKEDEES